MMGGPSVPRGQPGPGRRFRKTVLVHGLQWSQGEWLCGDDVHPLRLDVRGMWEPRANPVGENGAAAVEVCALPPFAGPPRCAATSRHVPSSQRPHPQRQEGREFGLGSELSFQCSRAFLVHQSLRVHCLLARL